MESILTVAQQIFMLDKRTQLVGTIGLETFESTKVGLMKR